jgi:hypothetical protein
MQVRTIPQRRFALLFIWPALAAAQVQTIYDPHVEPNPSYAGDTTRLVAGLPAGLCDDRLEVQGSTVSAFGVTVSYSIEAIPPQPCGLPPPMVLFEKIGPFAPGVYYAHAKGSYRGTPLTSFAVPFTVLPRPVSAVEYFSVSRDHYFITVDPAEMTRLDSGQTPGWTRTGQTIGVFPFAYGSSRPTNVVDVCRLYAPSPSLDTHFYSALVSECAILANAASGDWIMESPHAFSIMLPNASTGSCPERTIPLYRLYNGRTDVNHRYTVSLEVRTRMIAGGWIPEGYGPSAVAMCSPVQ